MSTPADFLKAELSHLTTFKSHHRPWHMPVVAGIAVALPILIGASFNALSMGLIASLGSMVILNLPYTGSFLFRMTQVLACSFGFVACFAIGALGHLIPSLSIFLFGFVTFWVAIFSRYYRLAPPAGVFILMATAISLFMPMAIAQIPFYVGLIAMGCLFSGMVACIYTLILIRTEPVSDAPAIGYLPDMTIDSLLVAVMVAASQAMAVMLALPRAYWVPVSCYIIISGMNVRSIWIKQVHRIVGTALGMLVAWWVLSLGLNAWGVGVAIFALVFLIETFVVRHYATAAIFITPLTIVLAEYSSGTNDLSHQAVILARFWDTLLGCLLGLLGGLIIHSPQLRPWLHRVDQYLSRIIFHPHSPREAHD